MSHPHGDDVIDCACESGWAYVLVVLVRGADGTRDGEKSSSEGLADHFFCSPAMRVHGVGPNKVAAPWITLLSPAGCHGI